MSAVYWLLVGSREAASSRIHGYRVHEHLVARGWRSEILFAPPRWMWDPPILERDVTESGAFGCGDVVVFQKVSGPRTLAAMAALGAAGVKTIYVDCDAPPKLDEARLADLTVCSSRVLADEYGQRGVAAVRYIPDAWEWQAAPPPRPAKGLRCVCFGATGSGKWAAAERLRALVREGAPDWTLVTIFGDPRADIEWDLDTAWRHISGCDAAVIPAYGGPEALAKSSNRAIQAMALGLPVVAYPIPSYREAIHQGRTGFLCTAPGEWQAAFQALSDPQRRRRMARLAYRYARRYYAMDRVGPQWEAALAGLGAVPGAGQEERRSERVRVLRETLRSREAAGAISEGHG
jgi:Glycosyl transferases group 1